MKLDKRTHDFLMYIELKNNIGKCNREDLLWLIEYLEDRCDFYAQKVFDATRDLE